MCSSNAKGFTLLELLFVIIVIGVLASIAIPSYNSYQTKLKDSQATKDILQISMMLDRWHTEHAQYPASLSALGSVPTDPWGNAYVYLNIEAGVSKGAVRKDKNLNPLNSDYDLYSMGADGQTAKPLTAAKSKDDIVRAGNGGFIGLATDF